MVSLLQAKNAICATPSSWGVILANSLQGPLRAETSGQEFARTETHSVGPHGGTEARVGEMQGKDTDFSFS